MRNLRYFAAIRYFLSDREIDELQAAIDGRREGRVRSLAVINAAAATEPDPYAPETGIRPTA